MDVSQLQVGVRFALYIILLPLFGVALFGMYVPDQKIWLTRDARAFRLMAAGGALLGLFFSFASLVVMTAAMTGTTVTAVEWSTVETMLSAMAAGTAWLIRAGALFLVLLSTLVLTRRPAAMVAAVAAASGLALAMLAWTGHGGMDSGTRGVVHAGSDIVHLLAAGAWIGGILAFGVLLYRRSPANELVPLYRALDRFALVGTLTVATLVLTGLVNSWLMIGPDRLPMLATTRYGQLLLVKLALFGTMLALAANNRFRLTPALGSAVAMPSPDGAVAALRRSVMLETSAAIGILAIVAWLGTLVPPASL